MSGRRIAAIALTAALALLVALPAAAPAAKKKRYVALTPFAANTLAALGKKPVAIGEGIGGRRELDRKLRNVPVLPLSHASNGPNLEQLAQYDPDVVFSERTWRAGKKAIRNLGIKVVEDDPARISSIKRKVMAIGKVVGERKKARKYAKRLTKGVKGATRHISSRPRVLMILGVGQTLYAFLPNTWGGDLVKRAGGSLLTDGLASGDDDGLLVSGGYAQLSDEEILIRDPDVIIAVPHGRDEDMDEIADNLRDDETLAATSAGMNDEIHVVADNTLLQASTKAASTIKRVRSKYLHNR
jgi:iron complex transport system substrate-binding protein